jgi:hypothetical protein
MDLLSRDGLVEPSLCADVPARLLDAARCGLAQVEHLQVFATHERVVFADRCRSSVQEVFAGVGDADASINLPQTLHNLLLAIMKS